MAHKTLIGGTAYDITGGRTLIGGTGYDITKGRTLVGGTGYDISFGGDPIAAFVELMATASVTNTAGRNSSSAANVSLTVSFGTHYIFAFCDGAWSISKNGTELYYSDATKGRQYKNGTTVYLSNDGTSAASVYGGTMIDLSFTGYTETAIDAILSNVTTHSSAGRNSSTTGSISLSVAQTATVLSVYNTYMGLSSPIGTVIFGNYSNNPSLIWYSNGTVNFSTNGTSAQNARGCSIISIG